MLAPYTEDYLLDKQIKIFQPVDGYRASSDAVLLAGFVSNIKKNSTILDVGSGTGAVSLCLAQRFARKESKIYGLELQPQLAELANYSAKQNNFDFLQYINADIRKGFKGEINPCSFDVVVTNPPYSEHDMPSPNQSKATAHNHSDFSLENWLLFCLKAVKPLGKIYMINRAEALPEICRILSGKAGNLTVLPIYSKQGQNAKRVLVCAQKDSKAPCRILPPFITHDENGNYTIEAQKILRLGQGFDEITLF